MGRFLSYRAIACLATLLILVGGSARLLRAQGTAQNATLFGTVTDSSGAAMAGATVEVTSPSLQGSKTATTDGSGNYRIPDLPVGTYRISYSMTGFSTDVRTDFSLSAGFSARVDISLKVGATSQTVEVTGQAPVVDTATTAAIGDISRTVMDAVPSTRSMTDAVYLTPGVRPSNTPDIGGSVLGAQQGVGAYGFAANIVTLSDGVDVMQQSGGEHGGPAGSGPGQLLDYDSLEQLQVISTGAEADQGEAGPILITTMKSGSNEYHGDVHAMGEPHWFQATNLPANSPGLGAAGNQLQYFWDVQGDVGGRIIRDKLWFWVGAHLERNNLATYLLPGRDGTGQGYNPTHQDDNEAKVTWQATKTLKFVGDYNFMSKFNPEYTVYQTPQSGYEPSYYYWVGFWNRKGEVTWTPNAKWLFDFLGGYKNQYYSYPNQAGVQVAGNPYTLNQTTGNTSGADFNITQFDSGSHDRQVYIGSGSYFPNGKHSFQFGSQWFWPEKNQGQFGNHAAGNYELLVKGTTTLTPFQLNTFNFPFYAKGKETAIGEYFKDTWRATTRLTLNLGIRFDHYHVFNSPVVAPAGQFSAGGSFPYLSVGEWNRVTPRIGVAYDLTGNGKTVIRGSYGMYNIPFVGEFDLALFNPASTTQTTYDWSQDTCQVTAYTTCAPSAAFLAALHGPGSTFTNATGVHNIYQTATVPASTIINPNLKMPYLHEMNVAFERELAPNLAVRAIYVFIVEEDMYDQTYPNRPITAYTLPYVTTYPTFDPVNGGKPLTIYTYPTSLAAANQIEFVNRKGNPDYYNSIGLSVTKRKVHKWGAGASLDLTKDHRYLNSANVFATTNGFGTSASQPIAPYQTAFPLDLTWDYTFKSYLIYDLPFKVTFGLNYTLLAGAPNYGTDQVNVPNNLVIGGVAAQGLGTVTFPVNQFGTDRNSSINVLNLRFGKVIPIKERNSLEFTLELFNALNSAPGTTVNYIYGAPGTSKQFGSASVVMPPLIGRIGATFKF